MENNTETQYFFSDSDDLISDFTKALVLFFILLALVLPFAIKFYTFI
jgi:hypothetical protein